jgi:Calcium binding protein from Anabaena CcbP.
VVGMAPEQECRKEMFVTIKWQEGNLAVPLSQLEGLEVDEETEEAIADWHYWVKKGYEF